MSKVPDLSHQRILRALGLAGWPFYKLRASGERNVMLSEAKHLRRMSVRGTGLGFFTAFRMIRVFTAHGELVEPERM